MKAILFLAIFLISSSCSPQHEPQMAFDQIEISLFKTKHLTKSDTVRLGQDGRDSIVRTAPFFFASKPSFLLAKLRNGLVYQYDFVFTQNISVIYRILNLFQVPRNSTDSLDTNYLFATRGYSNRNEFKEILDSMRVSYGSPELSTDTTFFWNDKGITLRSLNGYTTTIVSFHLPKTVFDDRYDWEFCSVIPDTILLNYSMGISRNELESLLSCKDTNAGSQINPDRKACVAELTAWGIRGNVIFDFDTSNKVTKFVWQPRFNSKTKMRYTFEAISLFIDDYYNRTHSKKDKKEDQTSVLYTWENVQETIYAYLLSNKKIYIGKAPKSFMKNFK